MATQAIGKQEVDGLSGPAFSCTLARLLESWESEGPPQDEAGDFSPAKALRGAKGILFAIGLEGGVLLSAFIAWQLIRSLR